MLDHTGPGAGDRASAGGRFDGALAPRGVARTTTVAGAGGAATRGQGPDDHDVGAVRHLPG